MKNEFPFLCKQKIFPWPALSFGACLQTRNAYYFRRIFFVRYTLIGQIIKKQWCQRNWRLWAINIPHHHYGIFLCCNFLYISHFAQVGQKLFSKPHTHIYSRWGPWEPTSGTISSFHTLKKEITQKKKKERKSPLQSEKWL